MDFHLFPDSPHHRVFPAPRRGLFYFLKQGTSLIFFLGKLLGIIAENAEKAPHAAKSRSTCLTEISNKQQELFRKI